MVGSSSYSLISPDDDDDAADGDGDTGSGTGEDGNPNSTRASAISFSPGERNQKNQSQPIKLENTDRICDGRRNLNMFEFEVGCF